MGTRTLLPEGSNMDGVTILHTDVCLFLVVVWGCVKRVGCATIDVRVRIDLLSGFPLRRSHKHTSAGNAVLSHSFVVLLG